MEVELDIAAAIDSLSDTVEQLTGKKPLRVKRTRMEFVEAPSFSPEQIALIRKKYNWTQEVFASALNVPRATVASWETGRKKPTGASFRLLEFFQNDPKTIHRSLERRRITVVDTNQTHVLPVSLSDLCGREKHATAK